MRKKQMSSTLKKNIKDIFLYLIVGGIATLVEWVLFYCFTKNDNMNYMLATSVAMLISTFANWVAGRLLMFKNVKMSVFKELLKIYMTSISGIIFNMAIMYVAVDLLDINKMISKISATGIVFFWNYLVRKYLIYRNK